LSPTPTGKHQPGRFVWFDLVTGDLKEAERFYSEVFGWTMEPLITEPTEGYTLVRNRGKLIAGMAFNPRTRGKKSRWIPYLSVADVDRAARQAAALGGKVRQVPADLPDRGRVAVAADPRGAVFGLIRARGGDPADTFPGIGEWLWAELWTVSPELSRDFYGKIAGLKTGRVDVGARRGYKVFESEGELRAGMVQIPAGAKLTDWLGYVRVEDVDATVARARAAGADSVRFGEGANAVTIVVDPGGAPLIVQEWERP
jgi:predicted enzyme related to lactoylglutathione lyase